ncbi:hypothetical protein [Dankookia sp. P2]|uniref:dioxygenase family protein n=1 Tax=Dankookia sp. P2 TaxID=3423955 RepID=UPI003D676767
MSPRPPTSAHTIGPFFPQTFFRAGDNDLARMTAEAAPTTRGERILLRGRLRREGGVPCVNAILEAWQADAAGRFRHPADPEAALADPDFLGWGRAWTDANGRYEFRSVLPGGFAEGNQRRAPHIDLWIMASGLMRQLRDYGLLRRFRRRERRRPGTGAGPAGAPDAAGRGGGWRG